MKLRDLGSTNGTYADGSRITSIELKGRMNLQFGLVPAVFMGAVELKKELEK